MLIQLAMQRQNGCYAALEVKRNLELDLKNRSWFDRGFELRSLGANRNLVSTHLYKRMNIEAQLSNGGTHVAASSRPLALLFGLLPAVSSSRGGAARMPIPPLWKLIAASTSMQIFGV